MKVQLAYEISFKNTFGSRVTKHLNAMMQHAIRFYKHHSLGTKITITPASGYIDVGRSVAVGSSSGCTNDVGLT